MISPGRFQRRHSSRVAARWRDALQWSAAALAGLIAGKGAIALVSFGPLAHHMADHILLMSVLAPALAMALRALAPDGIGRLGSGGSMSIVLATTVQLALLWIWHSPNVLLTATHGSAVHALMQASLLAAALWFWLEIFFDRSPVRWRALLALLLTGKVFCLLGVLLVFSPRLLYAAYALTHGAHAARPDALADQHLAGLLMLVACPLTYILAGVIVAARWLRVLPEANGARAPSHSFKS